MYSIADKLFSKSLFLSIVRDRFESIKPTIIFLRKSEVEIRTRRQIRLEHTPLRHKGRLSPQPGYTSHCWTHGSYQYERPQAIIPTRAQCRLQPISSPLKLVYIGIACKNTKQFRFVFRTLLQVHSSYLKTDSQIRRHFV